MTEPTDAVFFTLLGLYTGDAMSAADGEIVLSCETVQGKREWAIPVEMLDFIEAKGWVEIGEAGPVVTDRGRYWLGRWFKRRTKRDLSGTRIRKHAVGVAK